MLSPAQRRAELKAEYDLRIAQARLDEARLLDAAFCPHNDYIDGIEVRNMTLADLNMLIAMQSPIIRGQFPQPEDIRAFLWLLSPRFSPSRFARWRFERKYLRRRRWIDLARACHEYMRETFALSPMESMLYPAKDEPGKQDEDTTKTSYIAGIIHALVTAGYGNEAHVLSMPLRRIWQYRRIILAEQKAMAGKSHLHLGGEVDRLWAEYLQKLSEIEDK